MRQPILVILMGTWLLWSTSWRNDPQPFPQSAEDLWAMQEWRREAEVAGQLDCYVAMRRSREAQPDLFIKGTTTEGKPFQVSIARRMMCLPYGVTP